MSQIPTLVFENASIQVTIDLRAYRLAAVKKTAYRLADRCTAVMGDADALPMTLLFEPGTQEGVAMKVGRAFYRELLDQELREHVAEETAPMRALILAHAFSKTGLIESR